MLVAADTHVHIYPNHDLRVFLDSAFCNLSGLVPSDKIGDAARVLCLTEGAGFHAFRDLRDGKRNLPEGVTAARTTDAEALRIDHEEGALFLVAGRQIVTAERLEVLALVVLDELPDGRPAPETLNSVRGAGGVPVLAWAPGKWFGARGRVVREALEAAEAGTLWLGDTSMRPTCWPEPILMKRGRGRGFPVIAGSDPLPQPGEEAYPGTYGVVGKGPFDAERPASSLRALLEATDAFALSGRRCGPLEMARRWNRHRKNKRP